VQVSGTAWQAAMRIMIGVGDLVQRTGDDRTGWILGGRTIEMSGDAMCGLHGARGDEEHESTVCQWFDVKTTVIFYQWFDLKTTYDFLRVGLKIGGDGFSQFGLKTNDFRFLGLGLKTGSYGLVILTSKLPRRFHGLGLKIKYTTVC
jgi:hypothetical protein